MGESTTWLLQGGNELFIIYLLHNQLIAEEVKRQAWRKSQCRTVSREGPGFPTPLAWVWALLTFDHGCVWCSGNSQYFKQKLKATHWENGLWRFRKAAQFPWAAPGQAPSQFHLLFTENFRRPLSLEPHTHPPHVEKLIVSLSQHSQGLAVIKILAWGQIARGEGTYLKSGSALLHTHFSSGVASLGSLQRSTLVPYHNWGWDCGPIFSERGVKPLGIANEVCSFAVLTFLTVNLTLGPSNAPRRDVVFKSGPWGGHYLECWPIDRCLYYHS